jgi:hypothetical protein
LSKIEGIRETRADAVDMPTWISGVRHHGAPENLAGFRRPQRHAERHKRIVAELAAPIAGLPGVPASIIRAGLAGTTILRSAGSLLLSLSGKVGVDQQLADKDMGEPLGHHAIKLCCPLPLPHHHDKLVTNNTISASMPLAIIDVVELHDLIVGNIHDRSSPKAMITKALT